ncbi:MAG: hypothetical protein ACOYK9_05190 [Chlamydiia bacterium]
MASCVGFSGDKSGVYSSNLGADKEETDLTVSKIHHAVREAIRTENIESPDAEEDCLIPSWFFNCIEGEIEDEI